MKGFLRFAGVIEFILYIAGIIIYAFNVPLVGPNIFYFILFILLGPTIAVLLFAVAQILENTEVNENKIDKLNKKIDDLSEKEVVADPYDKQLEITKSCLKNTNDDSQKEIKFKSLTGLTTEEKKQYKSEIQSMFNQFPFYKYAGKVKERMVDVRDEAFELINVANTSEEAEKVVKAFSNALEELK